MKYLLVGINAKYIHSNLALYSLREYAQSQTGVNIDIAEYTINMPTGDILRSICEYNADFVGISTYIWNVGIVYQTVSDLKKINPDIFIALGGPEVSFESEEILHRSPSVDCIMRGEGEATFAELIKTFESGTQDLSTVAGLTYRSACGIISTADRACMDMNTLLFPYKDPDSFKNRIIYYESSRGCPFGCSYCLSSVDKTVRFRDIDTVSKELLFFIKEKVKQVKFVDRTFNINPARATQMLRFIKDNDNSITNFHFEIAGDILTDEEITLINSMRPALIQLEIGVQTTNTKSLCAINRRTDMQLLKSNIQRLLAPGNVHIHLDLIAGLPYEDYNSFKNSFNEVYLMGGHELQLGFLKMLKGAPINSLIDEHKIKYSEYAPYEVLSTKYISYEELTKLKECEEMLEIYHNSLQFTESEQYLLQFEKSPFDFYLNLAEYYKEHGLLCIESKRARRYEILLDYHASAHNPSAENLNTFRTLLTLDYYKREKAKSRPEFAPDISQKRKEINAFLLAHPQYNTPDVHIEPLASQSSFAVFDYTKRSPVTSNVTYIVEK